MKLGKATKTLLTVTAALAVYLLVCFFDRSTTKPGAKGQTFNDFIQSKRAPRKMELLETGNQQYVFIIGRMTPLWLITISSGPPCYVFDARGGLIDWTADMGDDSRFVKRWPHSLKREEISVEHARELFQKKPSIRASQVTSP
jgi:hypothetical protein